MKLVTLVVARQHLCKADSLHSWKHCPDLMCYCNGVSTVRHYSQYITVPKEAETRELTTPPLQLSF